MPTSNSPNSTDLATAIQAIVAQQAAAASTTPYSPYGYTKTSPWNPQNRFLIADAGRNQSVTNSISGDEAYAAHWKEFNDKWLNDAKWRASLIALATAAGIPSINSKSGGYDAQNIWDFLGQKSSDWSKVGMNYSPMQVLYILAGGKPDGSGLTGALNKAAKGLAGTHTSTSTNTSFDISNAETAKALTTMVLEAALGRKPTAGELSQYKAALNAGERANPNVSSSTTTTTTDALGNATSSNTSSTSKGGLDQAGKEQILKDKADATPEGQAYQTNNIFNQALSYLSGL